MRSNEMTRVEETDKLGVTRVNGRGLKHLQDQLRGEMEKELASQRDLGRKILDHGCAEHSPGWVEWWVVTKKEEKPKADKPVLGGTSTSAQGQGFKAK